MVLRGAVVLTMSLVLAAACSDAPTEPGRGRQMIRPTFDVDLNPAAAGYFIEGVADDNCYATLNPGITDADTDWLDDGCEYQIAAAFRPQMRLHSQDACQGWEPYWAAKLFSAQGVVRVAYMPAYYSDCGAEGHTGDSEMVVVDVIYNISTSHWEVYGMWTSAHYLATIFYVSTDRSRWTQASQLQYPDRDRGYPRVWVSKNKHANYPEANYCDDPQDWPDECHPGYALDRVFPVLANRNAGSRHQDLVGCVFSTGINNGSGRCESFYTKQRFNGWYNNGAPGASAYYDMLVSDKFESLNGDWGGGPVPPPPQTDWANIYGTQNMRPGNTCHWFAQTNIEDPTVEWRVNGQVVGTSRDLYYSASADFTLEVLVWDSSRGAGNSLTVHVGTDVSECFDM